jgi:isoleucyl-tRNA synthetase
MLKFVLPVSHTKHWHMESVQLNFFTDFRAAYVTTDKNYSKRCVMWLDSLQGDPNIMDVRI